MEGLDGEFSGVPGERSESYDGRTESLRDGLGAFPPDITAPAAENRPTESDADAHDVELSELHDVEEFLASQEGDPALPSDAPSDTVPQEVGRAALAERPSTPESPGEIETSVAPAHLSKRDDSAQLPPRQNAQVSEPTAPSTHPPVDSAEPRGDETPAIETGQQTDVATTAQSQEVAVPAEAAEAPAAAANPNPADPMEQNEKLDPKKAAEIAEAIKDAKDNPIEFLNEDGTIQARWATPTTDTPESLKMAPPQKLTDVVAPVADKYVGVPVEDRQQVAKDFGALVDDLFLNNAEQAGRSSYFPQDELRLKLETAGKSGLEVTLHSVRAADLGHEDDLNEQKIRGVRIQQFDENGDAREAVTYRLYADGTVRRWDEGDITEQARIYEEEGIPPPLFSGMPPAEVRAIFTDQTLPAYVHWETHTLPNQRVAQNVLGTQNRPISKAEFARLRAALTQSAIAPGRLKPPFTGITM